MTLCASSIVPSFSAGYTFCITALSLALCVAVSHCGENIRMLQICRGRAAGLSCHSGARFESVLKTARGNMAEKPAPLPTVNVHVGHGNVGEPHNGCHDGPAHCTAIGGIRWGKFPYMCLHASNRLLSELLAVCVHVQNRALKTKSSSCLRGLHASSAWHVQVFILKHVQS